MKPTGVPVQDEMFPEGVDVGLMDMDEVCCHCCEDQYDAIDFP
jgi:uncharacterized protein CbrC (UPF0167 family)